MISKLKDGGQKLVKKEEETLINMSISRLFKPAGKQKKTWNTPSKHLGKVHAVGYYKGHMSDAKKLWNRLDKVVYDTQIDKGMSYRMNNPEPLSQKEIAEAIEAGLEAKGQFCITKMQ